MKLDLPLRFKDFNLEIKCLKLLQEYRKTLTSTAAVNMTTFKKLQRMCNIRFIFKYVEATIENFIDDEKQKNNRQYEVKQECEKIYEWKHHLLRNWCQDQIKYKKLKNFEANDCWIINFRLGNEGPCTIFPRKTG